MKAMILAAGFGTRLKPLTDNTPKALIEVNNVPIIELQILKLVSLGFNDIIINVHHLAEKIIGFVKSKNWENANIEISIEENILETGGGLKKAAWFLRDDEPFLVHNVDVITNLNIHKMMKAHNDSKALSTIAVQRRKTTRYFLIDEGNNLCGWKSKEKGQTLIKRKPIGELSEFSFMGVHIVSPEIFQFMPEEDKFSLIDLYLTLSENSQTIKAFESGNCEWLDIGRKENLSRADAIAKAVFS